MRNEITDAPGWLAPESNRIIVEHVHNTVPKNGVVLELGSMFGATTQIMSKNINSTSHIFVIDWWKDIPLRLINQMKSLVMNREHENFFDQLISQAEEETYKRKIDKSTLEWWKEQEPEGQKYITGDTFYDWWKYFTKDLHNITHFRDNVTNVPTDKIPEVDLIIQDAQHHYEGVLAELKYWWPKLKPGGTLILDDYRKEWSGVIRAADEFFSTNKYMTKVPTTSHLLIVKKENK